ncbi:MAG: DMT family transporter [Tabrizicola sp.]|nr:DMT family transporter [Tabrizicola sp.]
MRLFLLTALTMAAFAANSVLNRIAVGQEWIGPFAFALVRLLSGAAMLGLILVARLYFRREVVWPQGWPILVGVGGLLLYLLGFSTAYLQLDAGTGALILFGAVQVTMFAGAIVAREALTATRWLGAGLAMAGVVFLLYPGLQDAQFGFPMFAMALAGLGWGAYSLAGRRQRDAQTATAVNFILAAPVMFLLYASQLWWADMMIVEPPEHRYGLVLAILSGAVTSGLGYALWYAILPALGAARAAVAQLTVPLLAMAGGALTLGELPGWRFWLATVLVLGGVALASLPYRSLTIRSTQ